MRNINKGTVNNKTNDNREIWKDLKFLIDGKSIININEYNFNTKFAEIIITLEFENSENGLGFSLLNREGKSMTTNIYIPEIQVCYNGIKVNSIQDIEMEYNKYTIFAGMIIVNGIQQEGYISSPMNYVRSVEFKKPEESYIDVMKVEYDFVMQYCLIDGKYDINIIYPTDMEEFEIAISCGRELPSKKVDSLKGCVLHMDKAYMVTDYSVRIPFTFETVERFR